MSLPAVSVLIPTFNRGPQVQKTLDSVLNQTCPPLEIIVVDDGSTDGTPQWIEAHYSNSIRVVRQPNGGVARARNRGLREARGEWVAYLDHDDLWYADKLEKNARLCHTICNCPRLWLARSKRRCGPGGESATEKRGTFGWLFGWHNPIVSMSIPLVRRDALLQIGGFDPLAVPADDWDLWLRLAQRAEFVFVPEVLVEYTLHDGQQRRSVARMFRAVRRVLGKYPWQLARRPLLWWWLVWSGAFVPSLAAYEKAKITPPGWVLGQLLCRAMAAHPLALLSPQWIALLARKLRSWR